MNKLPVLPILVLFVCFYSCKKPDQVPISPAPPVSDIVAAENSRLSAVVTSQTITAFISGAIMDEDGKSLAGVTVTAGSATVTTNDKGYFQFPGSVTVNKDYAVVSATLNGYFKSIRTFTPNASGKANHYFEIRLMKPSSEKTVAAGGGNVVLDNKVDITFPDAAVVTSAGAAYSGQYKVVARYINPASANFLETMPGMLAGLNDQDQLQALQSLGMAVVELKDASGNRLQIAPGKKATLKLPAPANGPSTIPLWHFNEKYGLWIQAGVATKSGDTYTAEVNHFSTWNLDLGFNSFKLDLQFKDQLGNALSGLHVEASMDGSNKMKSFYTDNEGKATLINCPESKPLIIKTFLPCDTTTKTLDPVTADRSETITVPFGPGVKSYTITGKITGCDNTVLANQPFKIAIQGDGASFGLPGVTDAQGNYTVTGMICNNGTAATAQALAFINNEYRYAPAVDITLSSSTYNAQICATATSGIADNFEIVFPDPVLDSLIRVKINKPVGTIVYGNVKNIDSLIRPYGDLIGVVNDLSGIQFCTNLKALDLRVNLSDLSLLKSLLNLQYLQISESSLNGLITDVSPLQNLAQLRSLGLDCPNLLEISPLQNLVQLQSLAISSFKLADISPLRKLGQLQGLNISGNVSDISPLANLTQMKYLALYSDVLSDLSPLGNLQQLQLLEIHCKQVTKSSLGILQNFSQLTSLTISGTSISDFSILQNSSQLQQLTLNSNQISDVSQFTSLPNLVTLSLDFNKITDISPLQTMTQLQSLILSFNQISDISSLKNMTVLSFINLENNLISDLTPLQNLNNLESIWIMQNKISDITPLINGVPKLQTLGISYQQTGTITQAQQDAFKNSHPNCVVYW